MIRFRPACLCLTLLFTPLFCQVSTPPDPCSGPSCGQCVQFNPPDPWQELLNGFTRFLRGAAPPRCDKSARCCGQCGQQPFAIVLSCSDSRVPPEILFNQGLGNLFIVRVAGNVASDEAIGSIEYAIAHLKGPRILVVLGHQECGAVSAAMDEPSLRAETETPEFPGTQPYMIPSILNRIYPVTLDGGNLEAVVKKNVKYQANLLRRYSPIIRYGDPHHNPPILPIKIQGAYYSFSNGTIETVPVN